MPSATATKRVKGKRIERAFIIGSEAWPLDETNTRKADTPPEHTKGWRVYVKTPDGQPNITTWLKKVQFKIFHTYNNPTRMIEEPPFQIEETGWGGFQVEVKLFFVPEVGSRPQDRSHFLQLEPYGDEAEQEKQKREKVVRSEFIDIIEFNEPTEALYDILTDETQFKQPKMRGKGKGKASAMKRGDGDEHTVELPAKSSATNAYSKETEASLLHLLQNAGSQLDQLLAEEDAKIKKVQKEKAGLFARAKA